MQNATWSDIAVQYFALPTVNLDFGGGFVLAQLRLLEGEAVNGRNLQDRSRKAFAVWWDLQLIRSQPHLEWNDTLRPGRASVQVAHLRSHLRFAPGVREAHKGTGTEAGGEAMYGAKSSHARTYR